MRVFEVGEEQALDLFGGLLALGGDGGDERVAIELGGGIEQASRLRCSREHVRPQLGRIEGRVDLEVAAVERQLAQSVGELALA